MKRPLLWILLAGLMDYCVEMMRARNSASPENTCSPDEPLAITFIETCVAFGCFLPSLCRSYPGPKRSP